MTIKENRNAAANIDQTPAPPTQSPEDNQDMEETEKATMIVVRKYTFFLYFYTNLNGLHKSALCFW